MIIHQMQQGSDEWKEIRKGKMTASVGQAIGNNGTGLKTLITSLMADYYSTNSEENYTNGDMERGNELEAYARIAYELETGQTVEQVGFIEADEFHGVSPDGLVEEEGLIEIKCLNNLNHFKFLLNEEVDTKYEWQMQMQLLVTDRKWCDLVLFNKNFPQSLLIKRFYPDEKKQAKLLEGIDKGKEMIKSIKANLKV